MLLITAATMGQARLPSQAAVGAPDVIASSWRAFGRNPLAQTALSQSAEPQDYKMLRPEIRDAKTPLERAPELIKT